MRNSLSAFGFLAALAAMPFVVTAVIAWSVLHMTEVGLLAGSGTVTTMASDRTIEDRAPNEAIQCPYLTSSGIVETVVDRGNYGYRGHNDCPLWIDVAA